MLCAHWDTRPQADQDKTNPTTPADGANDGGSGVGVLLEIARQLHLVKPEMGIDIIFLMWKMGAQIVMKQKVPGVLVLNIGPNIRM